MKQTLTTRSVRTTLLCLLVTALFWTKSTPALGVSEAISPFPSLAEDVDSPSETVDTGDQHSEIIMQISYSGERDQFCAGIGVINGVMLALVEVQEYGCELWRIDPGGNHTLFADMIEGEDSSGIIYGFGSSSPFEGWYYFGAWTENDGYRLWRTNGQQLERVYENPRLSYGFWPQSIQNNQTSFKGRNYIPASTTPYDDHYYSTDGNEVVREIPSIGDEHPYIGGYYTVFDQLILSTYGQVDEPWVFDGNEYQLLRDVATGDFGELFFPFWIYADEAWIFHAEVPNTTGAPQNSFYYTDGKRVTRVPHEGRQYITTINAAAGSASTRDYLYLLGTTEPGGFTEGLPVMRIGKDASSDYLLTTSPDPALFASVAILEDEAYVLADNRLFKLGVTSAEEESFELPGAWEDSQLRFVGSDAYFKFAYIQEANSQDETRTWVWNKSTAGLLKTEDGQPLQRAERFQHIGNDLYFYGADEANGWALRKIPGVVIRRLPPLAKIAGAWFDPATSGQGFALHPIDDTRTFFTFFGFEDDGSPLWLTGLVSTALEFGKPTTVEMTATSGGRFGAFEPGDISDEPWGTLEIQFDTCSKATAILDGATGQQTLNMIALTRVEGIDCFYTYNPPKPKTAGITGSWFDPATSGQGFVVHSINDEQALFSFFGFNNESERIWLLGVYEGQLGWNQPLELTMIRASGGRFGGFSPDDITETPWGTMTISFEDCENGTATLSGADGEQTLDLVKFAHLQGTDFDCP